MKVEDLIESEKPVKANLSETIREVEPSSTQCRKHSL